MRHLIYWSTLVLVTLTAVLVVGCTKQERARHWGGTASIKLDSKKKLVNAAWKEEHLWILTRNIRPGEAPETYELKESSSFGVMQGTIILIEQN